MCYVPFVRGHVCFHGKKVFERKEREKCVFCKTTRTNMGRHYSKPIFCPVLNKPGHVIVEPDVEIQKLWPVDSRTIIGYDIYRRVAQVWILEEDQLLSENDIDDWRLQMWGSGAGHASSFGESFSRFAPYDGRGMAEGSGIYNIQEV